MSKNNIKAKSQLATIALWTVLPVFLVLAGCDQKSGSSAEATAGNDSTNATAADNTANNARDRDNASLTPGDQGKSDSDRAITKKIRQALVSGTNNVSGTNEFSMTAKNVKIITVGGKVTLRGPVDTTGEKNGIELIAKNVAGGANVDDQLEVKTAQ